MLSVYITVFLLAFGLSMDTFAVSLSYGVCFKEAKLRSAFRFAFHTAFFQVLMPLLDWFGGNFLGKIISKIKPLDCFWTPGFYRHKNVN